MRIGLRLTLGFLVVVGMIGAIGAIALGGLYRVSERCEAALGKHALRVDGGLKLQVAVLQQVRAQKNYLLRGDERHLAEAGAWERQVKTVRRTLPPADLAGDRELLQELDRDLAALDQAFGEAAAAYRNGGLAASDALLRGKAEAVLAALDELVESALAQRELEQERARAEAARTRQTTLALILCIALVALGLGLALSQSVTRPLKRLQSQIAALASGGEAPQRPAVEGRDEVAQIARAFHETVQKAALLREMEARSRRLEALSSRVAMAQEAERERIARELHDGIGQALTAIKLDLAAAARGLGPEAESARQQLVKAQRLADESLDELRRLAFDLRPPALDNLGLVAALESYIRTFTGRAEVAVQLEADTFGPRLPFEVETALYRVCQEALTNIARHARASHAVVRLRRDAEQITLEVTDNGEGFDTRAVVDEDGTPTGVGLLSMERRAEELGGSFEIESAPGRGSTVRLRVPRNPGRQV